MGKILLAGLYSGLIALGEVDWKIKSLLSLYCAVTLVVLLYMTYAVDFLIYEIDGLTFHTILLVLMSLFIGCLYQFYSSGRLASFFGYNYRETENWYYPQNVGLPDCYCFLLCAAYLRVAIDRLECLRDYI